MSVRHLIERAARRTTVLLVAFGTMLTAFAIGLSTQPADAATSFGATLSLGTTLRPGDVAHGANIAGSNAALNHHYELRYQTDGNLVLYDVYPAQQTTSWIWQTRPLGAPGKAIMQSDGNFVVYGADGRAKWASGTSGLGVNRLVIQTDGNMVAYTAGNSAQWASRNGLCAKTAISFARVSTELSAACREVRKGTWYSYGGGHGAQPGASYGYYDGSDPDSLNDSSRKGFDCSGLTRWAYFLGKLADMPVGGGTAASQWQNGLGGARVSTSALAVGDLLYFGGGSPHHTAIYAGAGYMVEAQQSGTHLMVSPVAGRGLSGALRVF